MLVNYCTLAIAMKKMIATSLLLVLLCNPAGLQGQNLVVNPGFDEFTINFGPNPGDMVCICNDWYSPANGSPDYFNSAYNGNVNWWSRQIPVNLFGHQVTWNGCAYWGWESYCKSISFQNSREYIQSRLSDTLQSGIEYCVSLYVSPADTVHYAINGIGVLFTDTAVSRYDSSLQYYLLPFTPQIQALNIVSDRENWTRINGSFIADRGEQYITIGNFQDDDHTDTLWLGSQSTEEPFSYYDVDAVCVYDCNIQVYPADGGGNKYIGCDISYI